MECDFGSCSRSATYYVLQKNKGYTREFVFCSQHHNEVRGYDCTLLRFYFLYDDAPLYDLFDGLDII